jgi:hypothetical protein
VLFRTLVTNIVFNGWEACGKEIDWITLGRQQHNIKMNATEID